VFRRGLPAEICSKTLTVLQSDLYRACFTLVNRAGGGVTGNEVCCDPGGSCC